MARYASRKLRKGAAAREYADGNLHRDNGGRDLPYQNVADNGLSPQDKIAGGSKLSLLRPIRGAGGYDDTRGVLLYGQHGGFGGGLCGSFRGGVLRALADNGSACGKRGGIRGNADILKTATRFCERVVFAYRVHGAQSIKLFCKVLANP